MKPAENELTFEDFPLDEGILEGVRAAGFKLPSPIQALAIPEALAGKDIIGQAHTGTVKTAAFGLPLMSRLTRKGGVEVVVVTPTRELAGQVSDEMFRLGKKAGVKTTVVCGGEGYARQIKMVNGGAHVLVATPGRLLDLLKGGRLKDFSPSMIVLDEADEMLDMGFLEDVKSIFEYMPEERQTLLFSATMPKPIAKLAETILNKPVLLKTVVDGEKTNQDIDQRYYVIHENERESALVRLMEELGG